MEEKAFLNWCYVNDKKAVMMVMDTETFELIKNTLTKYQELKTSGLLYEYESDEWNFGYTRRDIK